MTTMMATLFAAAAGGALGAMIRVGIVTYVLPSPLGILVLNVAGALMLGFVLTFLEGRQALLTVFLGGGLMGALTTFSTFSGDAVRLASSPPLRAANYVSATVCGAILAFVLGAALARAAL